jgi:hypothetical protein
MHATNVVVEKQAIARSEGPAAFSVLQDGLSILKKRLS